MDESAWCNGKIDCPDATDEPDACLRKFCLLLSIKASTIVQKTTTALGFRNVRVVKDLGSI